MKYFLCFLIFFASCQRYTLSVKRENIGQSNLASIFARTPDPRQAHPPEGERYFIRWRIPATYLSEKVVLKLQWVLKDFSQVEKIYPIDQPGGFMIVELKEKPKAWTYRALLETVSGKKIETWEDVLWFDVVK